MSLINNIEDCLLQAKLYIRDNNLTTVTFKLFFFEAEKDSEEEILNEINPDNVYKQLNSKYYDFNKMNREKAMELCNNEDVCKEYDRFHVNKTLFWKHRLHCIDENKIAEKLKELSLKPESVNYHILSSHHVGNLFTDNNKLIEIKIKSFNIHIPFLKEND